MNPTTAPMCPLCGRPSSTAIVPLWRGMFAGLKLRHGGEMPRTLPWSLTEVSDAEASRRRVMYGLRSYVRARADVARMEVADLPVLPHQEIALAHAVELLEQEGDGLAMAAAAVLTEQPAMLTGGASEETDVLMALLAATEAHRGQSGTPNP